jgi:ribosomal protein L34
MKLNVRRSARKRRSVSGWRKRHSTRKGRKIMRRRRQRGRTPVSL